MQKVILSTQNVSKSFGSNVVLKDINLKIFEGESIVFIGPSGSGKSVLLKLLAGIYPPSSGQVFIRDENWQALESEEKHHLARKLGMMFQQGALFDTLTAFENVKFPINEHYDLPEEEVNKMATDILARVNLQEAHHKIPSELSGGMQKRLAIARALVLNPEVVFYDDPVAGQDPIQSDLMSDLILEFKRKNNSTLVMSTSNMRTAFKVADRIFMVVHKEVIETGNPEQTKNHSDPRVQQFINGRVEGPLKAR